MNGILSPKTSDFKCNCTNKSKAHRITEGFARFGTRDKILSDVR